jgi:hypothetical protein
LLGSAAIIRFQVGLIAIAAVAWLVWRSVLDRGSPGGLRLAPLAGSVLGGGAAAVVAGAVDIAIGRPFLGTVAAYLVFNLESASQFGTSAWYTYLLQLLVYTAPPATLLLARPIWQACRRHGLVALGLAVFVLAHSLVGHKEDRFLFPILPLLFVLLGAALADLAAVGRRGRTALRWFWAVNAVALFVAIASDAQQNLTRPLLDVSRRGQVSEVAVVGLRNVPRFYLGTSVRLLEVRNLDDLVVAIESGRRPEAILFRPVPSTETLERIRALGLACAAPRIYTGDFADRMLVRLNPRRNRRRQPTGLARCEPVGINDGHPMP